MDMEALSLKETAQLVDDIKRKVIRIQETDPDSVMRVLQAIHQVLASITANRQFH